MCRQKAVVLVVAIVSTLTASTPLRKDNAEISTPPPENPTTTKADQFNERNYYKDTNWTTTNQTSPVSSFTDKIKAEPDWPQDIKFNFVLFPIYLEKVDVRLATCRLHFYAVKEWQDKRLAWNPRIHGMAGGVRVSPKTIWTPDFEPYNGIQSLETPTEVEAIVMPSGAVRLVQSYILTTPVRRTQGFFLPACEIRFAAWNCKRLRLSSNKIIDLSRFTPSSQWEFRKDFTRATHKSGYLEVQATVVYRLRSQAEPLQK